MTTATGNQRRVRRSVALAVLALAAAACSDSSSGGEAAEPTTVPEKVVSTTVTTVKSVEADVIAGYRAFWDAYLAAADPMNPEDPRLVEHATGEELETVQKAFLARRSAGEVIRGTLDLAPRVDKVGAGATAATVVDCYADHTGLYDAATGAREDSESGVRHLIRVEMTLTDGAWKAASVALQGDGCTPTA